MSSSAQNQHPHRILHDIGKNKTKNFSPKVGCKQREERGTHENKKESKTRTNKQSINQINQL